MRKTIKTVVGLLLLNLLVANIPITHSSNLQQQSPAQTIAEALTQPKTAQAAPAAPTNITVEVIDNDSNVNSCTGGQYGTRTIVIPQTPGSAQGDVTDAPSSKDINCASITVDAGPILNPVPANQSMYNLDFRLGIEAWEANDGSSVCNDNDPPHGPLGWTRWASDGEGQSLGSSFLNGEEVDCLRVFVETRPLPAGTRIRDVKFGIGTGGQTRWTPWFSSGQFLTTGYAGTGDTPSVRIGLETDLEFKLDADHINDNVPRTAGQFTVGNTGNYTVDMRNIGGPWFSDQDLSTTVNTCTGPEPDTSDPSCQQNAIASCNDWQPQDIDDTCFEDRVVSSDRFKLKRLDGNTAAVTTPNYLKYKRDVQYQWSAYEEMTEICEPDPDGPGDLDGPVSNASSLLEKLGLVKSAQAAQGGPGFICHYEPTGAFLPSGPITNQPRDIFLGTTATFDLPITPQTNGSWELVFQMERDGVELFGDPEHPQAPFTIVRITIIVGNVSPWTFTCTASRTVPQGSNALYDVIAAVPQNYTNTITVTMDPSNPVGATMSNAPLSLSPANTPLPYQDIAVVPTGSLSPGNYILYFRAVEGSNVAICQAELVITASLINVDLRFNLSDGPVNLPSGTTNGELSWDTQMATGCTATMVSGSYPTWSGSKPVANVSDGRKFETVTGLQPNTSYEFKLTCVNQFNNSHFDTVIVNLGAAPNNPSVQLFCMGNGDSTPQGGPCTVPSDASAYLSWQTTNASTCTLLPGFGAVDPDDTAVRSTGPLTSPPTAHTYTITCQGAPGSQEASDSVIINVTTVQTPNTPVLSANNVPCGAITLTWTIAPPADNITFRVFHSTSSNSGPWTEITDSDPRPLPVGTTSFVHNNTKTPPPAATNNYYRVVAYNGSTPSADNPTMNITGPININPCLPNMNLSDKDLVSVGTITDPDSIYTNPATQPCNGRHDVIPEVNRIFKHGDVITYRMNVCNSGDTEFTSLELTDTLQNLVIVPNSFQYSTGPDGTTCKRADEQLNVRGNPSRFRVLLKNLRSPNPLAIPPETITVCSVSFQAVATAPSTLSGLYTFRNTAISQAAGVSVNLLTPYYTFSLGTVPPDREEIPPSPNQ